MRLDHPTLLEAIDAQRDNTLQFCADLVQRPSSNPPGDTRAVAEAVSALLEEHELPHMA